MPNIPPNNNNKSSFHESQDSLMDKQLPKRTFIQKYKFHIVGAVAFLTFIVYILIAVSGGRKLRIDMEKITVADVEQSHFMDYVAQLARVGNGARSGCRRGCNARKRGCYPYFAKPRT